MIQRDKKTIKNKFFRKNTQFLKEKGNNYLIFFILLNTNLESS